MIDFSDRNGFTQVLVFRKYANYIKKAEDTHNNNSHSKIHPIKYVYVLDTQYLCRPPPLPQELGLQ